MVPIAPRAVSRLIGTARLVGVVAVASITVGVCALACSLLDAGNTSPSERVDAETARAELVDQVWPVLVQLLEEREDIPDEDRDRIYRALGVLLAYTGRLNIAHAADPEAVVAHAGVKVREYSGARLERLTLELRDHAVRQEARRRLDQATLDAARVLLGRPVR